MVPDLANIAALIGDPVRSKMLFALLDGRELSASELAFRGEASAQSASGHLAKLVGGGLVTARASGRQRFFRLTSAEIAHAIEVLASIAPVTPVKSLNAHTAMQRLREARTCYDHLAGKLGVAVTDALVAQRFITPGKRSFTLTTGGERFFDHLGIDLETARCARREFALACLDWTERRPHVAGALGAALLSEFVTRRWVLRNARDRSLKISDDGSRNLQKIFGSAIFS